MPLEELEKKLYRPEEPKRPLEPSDRKFRPVVEEPTHEEEKAAKEWLEETKKPLVFTPKQKKISKIFFIIFILLARGASAESKQNKDYKKDFRNFFLLGRKTRRFFRFFQPFFGGLFFFVGRFFNDRSEFPVRRFKRSFRFFGPV